MSFQSAFTGEQIENVFHRVTNMVTGTVEITASMDGFGYGFAYGVPFPSATPKIFTTVRDSGNQIPLSDIAMAIPQLNLEDRVIMFQLQGEGIKGGHRYAVDYFIMD